MIVSLDSGRPSVLIAGIKETKETGRRIPLMFPLCEWSFFVASPRAGNALCKFASIYPKFKL